MKTQIFLLEIQENKRDFPNCHPQEVCKTAVGGLWTILRTAFSVRFIDALFQYVSATDDKNVGR